MLLRCIEIYWVILPRANFLLRPARQAQHRPMASLTRRPSPAAASRVWDFMMLDKVPVTILFPLSALLLGCCVGWQLPGDRTGALHPTPFPFEAAVILATPSPFPPLPFPWRERGLASPGSGHGRAATAAMLLPSPGHWLHAVSIRQDMAGTFHAGNDAKLSIISCFAVAWEAAQEDVFWEKIILKCLDNIVLVLKTDRSKLNIVRYKGIVILHLSKALLLYF